VQCRRVVNEYVYSADNGIVQNRPGTDYYQTGKVGTCLWTNRVKKSHPKGGIVDVNVSVRYDVHLDIG